ncbi:hypothetical protein AB6A40_005448 [Gnathostoma spinigerum]|uniref:Uncharacterized protein n=1 Tax=Gnathostoma spinigerum TaxID=75299 RepID=A0ABD6EN40_9BILA
MLLFIRQEVQILNVVRFRSDATENDTVDISNSNSKTEDTPFNKSTSPSPSIYQLLRQNRNNSGWNDEKHWNDQTDVDDDDRCDNECTGSHRTLRLQLQTYEAFSVTCMRRPARWNYYRNTSRKVKSK